MALRPPAAHRSRAAWGVVAALAASAALACGALPWAWSGRARRTGFSLAHTVDRLDLASTRSERLLLDLWTLLPLFVVIVWLALALGRHRWAGLAAVVVGGVVIAAVCVLARTPLPLSWGAAVAASTGALSVCAGLAASWPVDVLRRPAVDTAPTVVGPSIEPVGVGRFEQYPGRRAR